MARGGDKPGGKRLPTGISKVGRATTGAFRSTPLGIVMAASGLAPVKPSLDHRQAKFTQRLMARHRGHHGPEGILERRGSELTEGLRLISFLEPEEKPDELKWARYRPFPGDIEVGDKVDAYRTAKEWQDKNTI